MDEKSVLQFLPHSGADDSKNQTSTNVQNAITAIKPDRTILMSSLSACLNHLRICALSADSVDDTACLLAVALKFVH
jgi:hypothetical protein